MERRQFLSLPLVSALQPPPAARPNVVILLADDLGTRDLGYCGGEIQSPQLDRLASQGVRFDQFYAFPVCSPTRSGLMTGRSPMRLGVMYHVIRPWSRYAVPVDEHFISESFRAAGYQTAITGKWHLGHARRNFLPNARGFDHAYGHLNGAIDYYTHERDGGLDWNRDGHSLREEGYSTDLLAAEAIRLIKSRDRGRPLFLYAPFNAPHAPLEAPQALIDKYAKIQDPRRRTYAAMVDALDSACGRILATLEEEGMSRNTILLFLSDNGGPVNQGSRNSVRGAKGSAWEGGIRVPAVLRWPGVLPAGTRTSQVATVLDVFPTLAGAAGIPTRNRHPLDGRNLWSTLRAGKIEPREDLFFAVENGAAIHLAVRRREWKLVRRVGRDGSGSENTLYKLDEDPQEARDLSASNPALVKELVAVAEKWMALYPPGGVHAENAPPAGYTAPKLWAEAAQA